MTETATDVAIVGGGMIGLACAWRLSQRGRRVTVIDPNPAAAASRAAAGMLAPISEVTYGETALLHLATESLRRYPNFVEQVERATGQIVGLRREGTMIVATDAGDRGVLENLHAFQTSLGLVATMLTSRECRALEPMLAPEIRCGLLAASDHSVDNRRVAAALIAAIATEGATLLNDTVAGISIVDNQAHGVTLSSGGSVSATTVILAAGPWCAQISGVPESVRPPVRPIKGEILRLRPHGAVRLPDHGLRGLVNGRQIYLIPRSDGELVVGATVEEAGFDTSVRAGAVRELLRDARSVMPAIDEYELVETMAALRPGSPDNAPIVGATSVDGLIVATGHYRNGILLAPITADLVAALVTDTVTSDDQELLSVVSPQRFSYATRGRSA